MENNTKNVKQSSELKLTVIQKIILIYTIPTKLFQNLKIYPDWIIPVVIIILMGI